MNKWADPDVGRVMENNLRPGLDRRRLILRFAGAALLFATGAIHLDLYLTGYRSIPTIGGLFLLQVIVAFVLGTVVAVSGNRLSAAAGAGFALSTLGGYLLSLWIGLFGFREVRTTAGIVAGVIEVAAFAALAALALVPGPQYPSPGPVTQGSRPRSRLEEGVPGAGWVVAAVSGVAVVLLGVSVATAVTASAGSSTALLRVATIDGTKVITNNQRLTLYWFVPDTPSSSKCSGSCAVYWPPVTGSPSAGPGVTGRLGTIKRSDGSTQVTYDGHPLYTYVSDTAPGQSSGNGLDVNGGVWHEMRASG
jgi:predicted lipoprotein with Yx(FWY)xxD motif